MLIYTSTDMMPSVNEANPTMRLCTTHHCVGRNRCCGTFCKIIHDLDMEKWPDTTFAKWSALVDQTPSLKWNRKVVDPAKITARIAKLAGTSLTSTTSTKAKS